MNSFSFDEDLNNSNPLTTDSYNSKLMDNYQKERNTTVIRCLKCKSIPKIEILSEDGPAIKIICDCSTEKANIIGIEDYLSVLNEQNNRTFYCMGDESHSNNEAVEFCIHCQKWLCIQCLEKDNRFNRQHQKLSREVKMLCTCKNCNREERINNLELEYYCTDCNEYSCRICSLNTHKSHRLILLEDYLDETKFSIKKEIFQDKKTNLNLINNYKDEIIKELEQKISLINEEYSKYKKKNDVICNLLEILYNNYEMGLPENFMIKTNIIFNSNFNRDKFIKKSMQELSIEDIEMFIQFLKSNQFFKIKGDFLNGIEKYLKIESPIERITAVKVLKDGKLAIAFKDKTIRLFETETGKHFKNIGKHSDIINYFSQLENEYLLSCSSDKKICVWNINKGKKVATLNQGAPVFKVITISENRIASTDLNKQIKIWEANKFSQVAKIETNLLIKAIIQLKNKDILVGASDNEDQEQKIKFWDLNTYKVINIVEPVRCYSVDSLMQINSNKLAVGWKGTITIVDLRNYTIETIMNDMEFGNVSSFLMVNDFMMIIGGGRFEKYESENGNENQLDGKNEVVYSKFTLVDLTTYSKKETKEEVIMIKSNFNDNLDQLKFLELKTAPFILIPLGPERFLSVFYKTIYFWKY